MTMIGRKLKHLPLIFAGIAVLGGCASAPSNSNVNNDIATAQATNIDQAKSFNENELATAISTHLGVTAESAATAIERLFKEQGRPVGYITGEEGGGAFTVGVRYGKGTLWMKNGDTKNIFWQGPTVGFDIGAEASKVFTLVYGLQDAEYIYQRFPGAEGSAYLVAGMAVNYQRANGVTLAPVRSGVGVRLGANIGYTSYTRSRSILPF